MSDPLHFRRGAVWLRRSTALLLVPFLTACGEPAGPACDDGDDPQRIIMVRGRITTEDGKPVNSSQVSVEGATNYAPDCTGELLGDHVVQPDSNGFYLLKVGSPGLLPPQRCVWVNADTQLTSDTAGGIPATLRFRCGPVPLDTLRIDVVLKRQPQ